MNRITKTAAIAAIAAAGVIGTAGAASATDSATPASSTCTPSPATPESTRTEWQWAALVAKGGLHWEYKWTDSPKNPSSDIYHIWVKSLDLTTRGLPQKTHTVKVAAKAAVTCSTKVSFTSSTGQPLEGGEAWVVAPAGDWIRLGTTDKNGEVSKELAPGTYQFTMDYLGVRQTQTVLVDDDGAQVDFKTGNATATFTNSNGQSLAGGNAWVVAGGTWTQLGTTDTNGAVSKELPYGTYEVTMDYRGARQIQTMQVGDGGAHVDFKTASATVTFTNSNGQPLASGNAWVVAGGTWTELGTAGTVSIELLTGSTYEFTMDYGGARQSQSVLVDANTQVAFNTYRVEVRGQVTNAAGAKSPVLGGTWWYIAPDGNWRTIGTPDLQGDAITQLLPGTYTFVHVAADDTRHEFPNVTISANGRKVLPFVG